MIKYVRNGKYVEVTFEEFQTKILKPNNCIFHHSALRLGYQSVKHMRAERYEGRFGKGWMIYINNPNSTKYVHVEYYIEKGD